MSLTNRKWQEKIVEGHSTKPVHQERSTYPPGGHCGDIGPMSFAPLAAKNRRGVFAELLRNCYPILLNMQSHNCEANLAQSDFYPILVIMQSRHGVAASFTKNVGQCNKAGEEDVLPRLSLNQNSGAILNSTITSQPLYLYLTE